MLKSDQNALREVDAHDAGSRPIRVGGTLLDRVNGIFAEIAASAAEVDELGRVPDRNIELLRQIDFFRAFQPKRYGGFELDVQSYAPALVRLGEACASTAWVAALLAQHSHGLALFSSQVQDEIWGEDPGALIGSSVAPVGKAEVVEGGVKLSGRFGFSSGCDHAQWYILGFVHPGFEPPFHAQFAMVPRCDVTILDDWDTVGMRGTGSKTLVVEGAFVPSHRIESWAGLNTGTSSGFGVHDSPIYSSAFEPHFGIGFAAVSVGMARRLAELYIEKTKSRIKVYTGQSAVDRAPASMRLGRASLAIDAATALMEKDWVALDDSCKSGQFPRPVEISRFRNNQCYVVQLAIQAADELFYGAGASAWHSSNDMQRLWRNLHMAGSHAGIDYDTRSEIYGRTLLGLRYDPKL
jgi:alkylation response protein AidB-like acyl-CoA dehydrogenase